MYKDTRLTYLMKWDRPQSWSIERSTSDILRDLSQRRSIETIHPICHIKVRKKSDVSNLPDLFCYHWISVPCVCCCYSFQRSKNVVKRWAFKYFVFRRVCVFIMDRFVCLCGCINFHALFFSLQYFATYIWYGFSFLLFKTVAVCWLVVGCITYQKILKATFVLHVFGKSNRFCK